MAMLYEYDKMDDDALTKGWVRISGGRISEVAGSPSIYQKRELFAIAPREVIFNMGEQVLLRFDKSLLFSNLPQSPEGVNMWWKEMQVEVVGEPERKYVYWTDPVIAFTFDTPGVKTLEFSLITQEGRVFKSRTNIYIQDLELRNSEDKVDKRVAIAKTEKHSGGTLQIKYANNGNTLKKPLIIAEAFDASSITGLMENIDLNALLNNENIEDIERLLDLAQYDIVYLDYNDGTDDIFRNAALMKEALEYVNNHKDKSVENPNIVLGIGMGGLVARYALRSMELEGKDHDTWKYISLDAPHKGANVPLGLQAMIRHLEDYSVKVLFFPILDASTFISDLSDVYKLLDCKAARQMLIYYCDKGIKLNTSDHRAFIVNYDYIGFPEKCQNVTASNGTSNGLSLFNPGTQIFSHTYTIRNLSWLEDVLVTIFGNALLATNLSKAWLLNILPGSSSLKMDFTVNALPDKAVEQVYKGRVYQHKKILWVIGATATVESKTFNSQASMLALDGAPGSFMGLNDLLGEGASGSLKDLLSGFKQPNFTVIPTASALALNNWQQEVFSDFRDRNLYVEGLTEFNYIEIQDKNYGHQEIQEFVDFLFPQLISSPVVFEEWQDEFCGTATFRLKNRHNTPVSWQVSEGFSLSRQSLNSVVVNGHEDGKKGILTVSSIGISTTGNAKWLPIYRRITSTCPSYISGYFRDGSMKATFRVDNLPSGTPISWTISDNTNFSILSAAADSVVIEAFNYDDKLTIKASYNVQDKDYTLEKQESGPKLMTQQLYSIDCEEKETQILTLCAGYEAIEWTVSPSLEIISGQGTPKIKLRGLHNDEAATVTCEVKKGKWHSYTQTLRVRIVNNFRIKVVGTWADGTKRKAAIEALPDPYYDYPATSYKWSTTNGYIQGSAGNSISGDGIYDLAEAEFNRLFNYKTNITVFTAREIKDLSPTLYMTLVGSKDPETVLIERVATYESPQGSSVTFRVSEPNQSTQPGGQAIETYLVYKPDIQTFEKLDQKDLSLLLDYSWIKDTDQANYAILTFDAGTDCTVSCKLITPCQGDFSHSAFISGTTYSCSYSRSTQVLRVSRQEGYVDKEEGYKVLVYDNYGLIKEVPFSSSDAVIEIPVTASSATITLYVNIVDNKGNVVERKTILVG